MKFFVYFRVYSYDGFDLKEFDDEDEVEVFLNSHSGSSDFSFTVIEGDEVEYAAVESVLRYRRV